MRCLRLDNSYDHGQKLETHSGTRTDEDDDEAFLPEISSFDSGDDMNISPALRALMAKFVLHLWPIVLHSC